MYLFKVKDQRKFGFIMYSVSVSGQHNICNILQQFIQHSQETLENLIFCRGPLDFTSLHGLSPSCIYKYLHWLPAQMSTEAHSWAVMPTPQASGVWTFSLLGQANKTTATNSSLLSGLHEKPQFETQTSFLLCKQQSFFVQEQFRQHHQCFSKNGLFFFFPSESN